MTEPAPEKKYSTIFLALFAMLNVASSCEARIIGAYFYDMTVGPEQVRSAVDKGIRPTYGVVFKAASI